MGSAARVCHRHELFLWAQEYLYSLIPHDILICLRLQRGNGASHIECVHCMVFDPVQETMLCNRHDGLAVRLALFCEQNGALPGLVSERNSRHAKIHERFRDDLNQAGLRNALIHGHRTEPDGGASFFMFFNLSDEVGPVHGQLMQLLLPHLHLAFNRVIGQDEESCDEAPLLEEVPSITGRQRQILQWICNGKSNYEIGIILDISPLTVKNHVQTIFRKFKVHNRAQAVSRAMSLNFYREAD